MYFRSSEPKHVFVNQKFFLKKIAVLWIHISFNADPDPAFYLNADPDPGIKLVRIHAKIRYVVNFGQIPCSWIRIRIRNTEPDPQHWVGVI